MDDRHRFAQLHIDVARNSTDDFNPFHDPRRHMLIAGNPYPRPIALGFQLECLCAYLLDGHRDAAGENRLMDEMDLRFRNFQFTFADAVCSDEEFEVEIRPSTRRDDPPAITNRIVVRKGGRPALLGQVRDARAALVPIEPGLPTDLDLRRAPDRSPITGTPYFLKRKFLNTANAKNFLAGSRADQAYYLDELDERVRFPDLFPCALASCALLEKAWSEGHDFMANPMVYVAHAIAVDRRIARALRSNDALHILVEGPLAVRPGRGLGGPDLGLQRYRCFGIVHSEAMLYRAEIDLAPLAAIARPAGS
jgi:hypothetical protein